MDLSREWWSRKRDEYTLYVSDIVIFESQRGDPRQVERRLELIAQATPLVLTDRVSALASLLRAPHLIPGNAANDALHIALATFYDCQYLLTWNFKHILNSSLIPKIRTILKEQGYELPDICTPESLLG
jgi:predicted nucleic acid-binding protein